MITDRRFHLRGFVTFILTISFVVSVVSGVVLFVAPPGRIAHWTNWKVWGLTKEGWEAVHTIFALVFLISGLLHFFWFNWAAFWGYLKSKAASGIRLKRELSLALGLCLLFFAATAADLPPFSSLMALGDRLKASWPEAKSPPPIPHAELMTIRELCQRMELDLQEVLARLRNAGIQVTDGEVVVREVARENGLSPAQLYLLMTPGAGRKEVTSGGGVGRRTLEEVCNELGFPVEKALAALEDRGIEAKAEEELRVIASRCGMRPTELVTFLSSLEEGR